MMESEAFASSRLRGKTASLRFGIMCNGPVFQQWQANAILELKKCGHQPALLVIDGRVAPKPSLFSRLLKKNWGTVLFTSLENRIFKPPAKNPVDLQAELQECETLVCHVQQKGFSEYFQPAELEIIRARQLDFILRFGFSIVRGEVLSAARFGIWSFHHDDEMRYRGGPAGFWEIFNGDPVSGVIMQRLTDKLDGGILLKKGYLKTVMHSYRANVEQLLAVSSSWPARVADELALNPDLHITAQASKTDAPIFKVPGNLNMLKFILLLIRNRVRFYYRDLFAAEFWNIGVIEKPIHEVALGGEKLRKEEITWFPAAKQSRYLADPAGFMEGGKLHILAEDYSYARQKAGISEFVMENAPVGVGEPVRVIETEHHVSYPYVIEHSGEVYCLPESCQSSGIALYRREQGSATFKKHRTLLDNVEAVDPTLLLYNGAWWLFFTGRKHSNTHLYLYYSPDLDGAFQPHRLNPVKTDVRSARPAGTPFVHEGFLYRPAQDCSVTYGGRVALNRVLVLNEDNFSEETVRHVEPVRGSAYGKALHTLSGVGDYTLVDGKKYKFNRHFFWSQLRKKMNRKDPRNV